MLEISSLVMNNVAMSLHGIINIYATSLRLTLLSEHAINQPASPSNKATHLSSPEWLGNSDMIEVRTD